MKKGRLGLLLIIVIGSLLFSIHTQAKAENWKHFFKDKNGGVWYYDKDSIHYPYNTKGLLGSIKPDRNIVRVWTKVIDQIIFLEELRCSQRESQTVKFQDLQLHSSKYVDITSLSEDQIKELELVINKKQLLPIIPGSWEETLYNDVCK